MNLNPETLYDRIGGDFTVNAAVDIYYEKVLNDERINIFFKDICMNIQMEKLKSFLKVAFGNNLPYKGKSLREVHAPMVKRGLNNNHIDVIVEHMRSTLEGLGIDNDLIIEAVDSINSYRSEVLGQ